MTAYLTRRIVGMLATATDRFFGAPGSVANAERAVEVELQKARHRRAAAEALRRAGGWTDRATS